MTLSLDKAFGVPAAALKLRAERHQVLSDNLANADTPRYKARDFDFRDAMRKAEQGQSGSGAGLMRTDSRHLPGTASVSSPHQLLYRVPFNPSLDGNTVESQVEQAKFAENSVNYQASLNFLGSRITGLIGAIRGE